MEAIEGGGTHTWSLRNSFLGMIHKHYSFLLDNSFRYAHVRTHVHNRKSWKESMMPPQSL